MNEPTPAPVVVETKVKWAAVAGFLAPLALAIAYSIVNAVLSHPEALDNIPPFWKLIAIAAAAGAASFFAGYMARHTPRQ